MSQFELIFAPASKSPSATNGDALASRLPWEDDQLRTAAFSSLTIPSGECAWIQIDPHSGQPALAPDRAAAVAGLRVVERRLSSGLAMLALGDGVLVNGLAALQLSVLSSGDSVVLAPGAEIAYVAERITPYIGPPTDEMIDKKQKCPFCRIPFSESRGSRVITCRCSAAYHWDTPETHPDTPDDDRLACFPRVKTCLSCSRPLTSEESLTFDPATL